MHHRGNHSISATPTAAPIGPFPQPFAQSLVGTTEVGYFVIAAFTPACLREIKERYHRYGTDDR